MTCTKSGNHVRRVFERSGGWNAGIFGHRDDRCLTLIRGLCCKRWPETFVMFSLSGKPTTGEFCNERQAKRSNGNCR